MKYQISTFRACFAAWVAATLALGSALADNPGITPSDNSYGEIYIPDMTDADGNITFEGGSDTLSSLAKYSEGLAYWKNYISWFTGAWSQAKVAYYKANALWEATDALARGLQKDLESNYTKKTDFDKLNKDAVTKTGFVTAMSNSKSLWSYLFDDYAKKSTTDNHERRITSLENRPIGGGGAGCGDDCKQSLTSIATFLGDSLAVADNGTTGSCVTVTASGTLFDNVLNKLPVCYYGSAFEVGSSAPVKIFEDAALTIPAFGAADIWAGEGLEAAVPVGPTVKKQLNVKVKTPDNFTAKSLGQMLDGDTAEQNADGTTYEKMSGIAAVDDSGHLRKITVGSISLGVDGNTIVREKKEADQEDSPLVLKAKIANMVDGSTIKTEGEGGAAKARVNIDALCDNSTIGVNGSNKLYVKKSACVKVVGTDGKSNWPDGDTETPAQTITFASASDSNVKVTVTGSKDSATVTIGVYYK